MSAEAPHCLWEDYVEAPSPPPLDVYIPAPQRARTFDCGLPKRWAVTGAHLRRTPTWSREQGSYTDASCAWLTDVLLVPVDEHGAATLCQGIKQLKREMREMPPPPPPGVGLVRSTANTWVDGHSSSSSSIDEEDTGRRYEDDTEEDIDEETDEDTDEEDDNDAESLAGTDGAGLPSSAPSLGEEVGAQLVSATQNLLDMLSNQVRLIRTHSAEHFPTSTPPTPGLGTFAVEGGDAHTPGLPLADPDADVSDGLLRGNGAGSLPTALEAFELDAWDEACGEASLTHALSAQLGWDAMLIDEAPMHSTTWSLDPPPLVRQTADVM